MKQSITVRYPISLLAIVVLISAMYFMQNSALKESRSTMCVLSLSQKQKVLSQNIEHAIHQLSYYYTNGPRQYEKIAQLKAQLKYNSAQLLANNRLLSTGELDNGSKFVLSKMMKDIYFEKLHLAERVREYEVFAKDAIQAKDAKDIVGVKNAIELYTAPLLEDLHRAVEQFKKEGASKIEHNKVLGLVLWLLILLIIALEVIFIFQPMTRKISDLVRSKKSLLESLQQKVELRTFHLEEANKKLQEMAYHDPLTGLRNRLSLESDIDFLLAQHKNNHAPFAVLMFDIDYFKELNDTYGHDFGDIILEELAKLFNKTFRKEDKIYRTGGEEFVVLLNRSSYEDALLVAHSTLNAVRKHTFHREDLSVSKTVSCGLYHSKIKTFTNYKEVLKAVDIALYEAKEGGRDVVRVYQREHGPYKVYNSLEQSEIHFEDDSLQNVLYVDKKFEQAFGYTQDDFGSDSISFKDLVHPSDQSIIANIKEAKLQTIRLICVDKKTKIFRFSMHQTKRVFILKLQDVLELGELVGNSMLLHNFNTMMQNSDDYIYFKDSNHLYTAVSQTLTEITSAKSREELIAKTDYELFDSFYADKYHQIEKDILSGNKEMSQEFQPMKTKDGDEILADDRKYPIKTKDGEIIGLFGIARECKDPK